MNIWVINTLSAGRLIFVLFSLAVFSGCDSPEERAQAHYERGVELVAQGEPEKASLEFRNALKLKEDLVPALMSLGRLERQKNRFQQAARIFASAAERLPEHVEARVELARILLLAGQLDEAHKYADQAYVLASTNTEVLVLKAAIALKLGNTGDAVRFASAVLETAPDNVDALIVRAAERLSANDPKGALSFLDQGTEKNERNVGLQLFRMKSLAALQDTDGIEGVFAKLIEFYPENAKFRHGLARWYLRSGRKDEAEKVIRRFAEANPDNIQMGLQLVAFLRQEKGIDAARAELQARIAGTKQAAAYKLALAEMTFGQGQYAQAVDQLKKLIAETEKPAEVSRARILLASMMLSENELPEAEKLIETVLEGDGNNVSALSVRASIRVAQKLYTEAIEDLSAALNQDPDSSHVLQLLAQVYELNGSVELAQDHFAKAARIERFKPAVAMNLVRFLLRYGKSSQAERVLTEIRGIAPSNNEVLTLLARLRLARQDWLGAHEIADVLRKLEDRSGTADLVLAEALSGQERHDESIKLLKTSVSDANDENSPIASLVRAYIRAGQPTAAEEFLQTILTSNPNNLQAQILLGGLHEFGKRMDKAEAAYNAVVEQHPNNIFAYRALAEFYLRDDELDAAETVVRNGLAVNENNLTLRLLLALVLEQTGRYDQAIAEYELMFKAEPRSTIVANNLASLLADHRGDDASVEKAYTIAVRLRHSNIPQFLDTLGWIHYRRGEYEEAVTFLKTAAEKLPSEELVQYHLGMAYKGLGRKTLAVESLKRAMALSKEAEFPQREKAQAALDQLTSAVEAQE